MLAETAKNGPCSICGCGRIPWRDVGVRNAHKRVSKRFGLARRSGFTGKAPSRQSSVLKIMSFPRHLPEQVGRKAAFAAACVSVTSESARNKTAHDAALSFNRRDVERSGA